MQISFIAASLLVSHLAFQLMFGIHFEQPLLGSMRSLRIVLPRGKPVLANTVAVRDAVSRRTDMDRGGGHSEGVASISLANVWSRWFYYLVLVGFIALT